MSASVSLSGLDPVATKKQRQMAEFLTVLEEKTEGLSQWTRKTEQQLKQDKEGFESYLVFRRIVSECEGFLEVVERRMEDVSANGDKAFQLKLDELTVRQLTLATNASLKFLRYLSEKTLPLGSMEVFTRELKDLHRMREILEEGRLKGHVSAEALEDQKKVEAILEVVITQAPELFDFGNKKPNRKAG